MAPGCRAASTSEQHRVPGARGTRRERSRRLLPPHPRAGQAPQWNLCSHPARTSEDLARPLPQPLWTEPPWLNPQGGGQGRAWDGAGALRPDLGQSPTTSPQGLWDLVPHCQAPGEGCRGRSVSEGGCPEPGRGRTGSRWARSSPGRTAQDGRPAGEAQALLCPGGRGAKSARTPRGHQEQPQPPRWGLHRPVLWGPRSPRSPVLWACSVLVSALPLPS